MSFFDMDYKSDWWKGEGSPLLKSPLPGPRSKEIFAKGAPFTSLTGRASLCPVVFEHGVGPWLTDVDGNRFLDLSSGIYVTSLGHSHPRVSSAVASYAGKLMNCHDYMTEIRALYFEKLASTMGPGMDYIHIYDNGSTAVEFAIRAARSITGRYEIITLFQDHHGKTMGAAALGRMNTSHNTGRTQGFYTVPRPDTYRPLWRREDGSVDVEQYLSFYEQFILESTTGNVAAFVVEPIQGWGGTVVYPDDFLPKLSAFCRQRGILLVADEILTGAGRTGKWLATEHWGVKPDIVTLGKGLGNGFPMSALITGKEHTKAIARLGMSSTYGGNPMACAAGLAVIESIEEESLLENCRMLGTQFMDGLEQLKQKYSFIGDVRGKGCLLGMEFVSPHESQEPLVDAGAVVYEEALKLGLVAGIPTKNLLRLAPPIILDDETAGLGLELLGKALDAAQSRLGL